MGPGKMLHQKMQTWLKPNIQGVMLVDIFKVIFFASLIIPSISLYTTYGIGGEVAKCAPDELQIQRHTISNAMDVLLANICFWVQYINIG